MSLATDNGILDRLFLLDKVILEIDPTPWNICLDTLVPSGDRRVFRIPMKSLLEAVAIIMLFFLTPLILLWVLVSLARVIENIGDLPIDEREPRAAGACASS